MAPEGNLALTNNFPGAHRWNQVGFFAQKASDWSLDIWLAMHIFKRFY